MYAYIYGFIFTFSHVHPRLRSNITAPGEAGRCSLLGPGADLATSGYLKCGWNPNESLKKTEPTLDFNLLKKKPSEFSWLNSCLSISITELESIWNSFLKYVETTCDLGSRIQKADSEKTLAVIGVGRLVSTINCSFSGSMLIYQGVYHISIMIMYQSW
jgi:hypothetical protein